MSEDTLSKWKKNKIFYDAVKLQKTTVIRAQRQFSELIFGISPFSPNQVEAPFFWSSSPEWLVEVLHRSGGALAWICHDSEEVQKPLTQLSARKKLISSRGDWGKELHHFSKTGGQTWDPYGFCLFSLSTAALGHCAPLNFIIFIRINCSALCKRPKNIFFSRDSTFSKSFYIKTNFLNLI